MTEVQESERVVVGSPFLPVPSSHELYRTESYSERYSEMVAVEGTNPIPPPNSEEVKRTMNKHNSSVVVVYGILRNGPPPKINSDSVTIETPKKPAEKSQEAEKQRRTDNVEGDFEGFEPYVESWLDKYPFLWNDSTIWIVLVIVLFAAAVYYFHYRQKAISVDYPEKN